MSRVSWSHLVMPHHPYECQTVTVPLPLANPAPRWDHFGHTTWTENANCRTSSRSSQFHNVNTSGRSTMQGSPPCPRPQHHAGGRPVQGSAPGPTSPRKPRSRGAPAVKGPNTHAPAPLRPSRGSCSALVPRVTRHHTGTTNLDKQGPVIIPVNVLLLQLSSALGNPLAAATLSTVCNLVSACSPLNTPVLFP